MPKLVIDGAAFSVKRGDAVVDVADDNETELDFGCRDGQCGTCIMTVVSGADQMSPPSDEERDTLTNFDAEPGQRLACQVKILGDCEIRST